MKEYENLIIGFGKAGKTLAGTLAKAGQKTAIVERDDKRWGGTCINVACIPTKSLEYSARLSAVQGGDFAARAGRYRAAVAEKRRLTAMLRGKNYDKAVSSGVEVIHGGAEFIGEREVKVTSADGASETLRAHRVFIDTGSRPFVPPIPGAADAPNIYTSETLMERDELPADLVIIGGGYIGLEFASYYLNFGSSVTILQDGADFIPREDAEIAAAVYASLTSRGAKIIKSAKVTGIADGEVRYEAEGRSAVLPSDAVLVATGRRPELTGLNPGAAGIRLTTRGAVEVDEHLRTSAPNVWAMGDVTGGLQFTYISLDDFRIVKDQLFGAGKRTTLNRGAIPYSVFLDPPLSRVGLSEAEAAAAGKNVRIGRLPAAAIPKAQVLRRPTGLLKAIVDADSGEVLGVHLFCAESQEMINLAKAVIDAHMPYTVLRDAIYNHPTMTEAYNDLFSL